MNQHEMLTAAAHNNVDWCDTLCALHGGAGERHATHWIQRGAVPPYMSNLITVAGATFRGVGIPACVRTATAAAERVAAHLAL